MTVLEQCASQPPRSTFVEQLLGGDNTALALPAELPDLVGYVDLAIAGGYPPAVRRPEAARRTWLRSYVEQLVLRDP